MIKNNICYKTEKDNTIYFQWESDYHQICRHFPNIKRTILEEKSCRSKKDAIKWERKCILKYGS